MRTQKLAGVQPHCTTLAIPDQCLVALGIHSSKQIVLLVQHGAKLQQVDRGGASALHRAVRARSPAAVRQLLKAGARVDAQLHKGGSTPLHLAVQSTGAGGTAGALSEQLEIIEMLLQPGADPGAKNGRGRSALNWAKSERILAALQKR